MSASLLDRAGHAHDIANERQQWAIDLFTTSSGNDSYLRIPAGWSRRQAVIPDRGDGRAVEEEGWFACILTTRVTIAPSRQSWPLRLNLRSFSQLD